MTKTVTYKDDAYDVTLVVRQASRRDRIRFDQLRFGGQRPIGSLEERVATHDGLDSYAACMAVTEIEGLEVGSLDQFLDLPDALVDEWFAAVVEENPHWFPFLQTPPTSDASTES